MFQSKIFDFKISEILFFNKSKTFKIRYLYKESKLK